MEYHCSAESRIHPGWSDDSFHFQEEYFRRHPRSLNPVLPNDLLFVLHGTAAGVICGIQALVYERRHQTLSLLGQGICGMYGLTFSLAFVLVLTRTIHLLDFLYVCSYIKLVVTVTKYVPQVSGRMLTLLPNFLKLIYF